MMMNRLYLLLLLIGLFSSSAWSQLYIYEPNHPELKWETIETDNFLVHYHQGTRRTANIVADIAEDIHPAVIDLYDYTPSAKVEFFIVDTRDYSNGGAYFYDNKIEIWTESLDYVLRGTHNWLWDVITHEYIHIISLQKSLKFGQKIPANWFQAFGYERERRKDVVRGFPNVLVSYPISGVVVPVWFAEGVAQYQSNAKRFDYRDSHREMILRDRILTDNFLTLSEMNVFGKNSIGNESSYNQGFSFSKFLAEKYGEKVLSELAGQASNLLTLTFNGVIKKVTGEDANVLYNEWKAQLTEEYTTQLKTVQQNLISGESFVGKGIGNMHPQLSPDGKKVAYLASGKSSSLGSNVLVVQDLDTDKKKNITARITGSYSWSPDGKYLAYSKVWEIPKTQSLFNDLYIYDLAKEKEYRISEAFRARHPDWSNDGSKLTFVVQSDGLANLYTMDIDVEMARKELSATKTTYYDLDKHLFQDEKPSSKTEERLSFRKVRYNGENLRQLTHFVDGRQIYHPRWAPDDSYIIFDTSTDFGRDIAKVPANGGEMTFVVKTKTDERYPDFHPKTGELIYASDETGIYNVYLQNLESGEKQALTNVIGGAFMPTISAENDLFFALYRNQGYKIHRISQAATTDNENLAYIDNYQSRVPTLENADQSVTDFREARPYRNRFSPVTFMPRVWLDYGTLKLGSYVYTTELLNKMSFFSGVAANVKGDYDLFAIADYDFLKHKFFIEIFNTTANINDTIFIPESREQDVELDINFNLTQAGAGFETTALPWNLSKLFYTRLEYLFSFYRAKIGNFVYFDQVREEVLESPPFRYTYLRGHAISLLLRHENVKRDLDRAINPSDGRYISFKAKREWNKFLDDFATDRVIGLEEFKNYNYMSYEANWEEYFSLPLADQHTLTLRAQGAFVDTEVDSFFHYFGGGLVGMKGYPFYSIEGRKLLIGSATYRFPLFRNINKTLLNMHLHKLYLGGFFQYGNAWSEDGIEWDDFLSDVGVQLRLDTFSWNFFPTRIFFEAAYPLKEHFNAGTSYPKEWKFYFGVLFDFDLRLEKRRFF